MSTVIVCFLALAPAGNASDAQRKATPLYTNADLDRVAPLRGETGATSEPAVVPTASRTTSADEARESRERERAEAYWRREAERHRARVAALHRRADELRARIAEAVARPGRKSASRSTAGAEVRLRSLENDIREAESGFEERARRAGALPGWLR